MENFAGRDSELDFLERQYDRTGSQLIVVYGNKGVGKTRLLQEFCRDREWKYYLARACSEKEQRYQWSCEQGEAFPFLEEPLSYGMLLKNACPEESGTKKVLILDEFHSMVKGGTSFFQEVVQFVRERTADAPVMLVLVTSASGWVENSFVGKIGGLAASISGFLKVRELPFSEISSLFPEFSWEDRLGLYSVLGGIPGYWKDFSPEVSFQENLLKNVLRKESRLYREFSFYVEQELREPAVYNTILATLARDCCKLNDIHRHTGFSRAKISVYLKNLMELDLVEKVSSYETDGWKNVQKGIYRIENSYVKFYYRYLFPNQSFLQMVSPKVFWEEKVKPDFYQFLEEAYRRICRQAAGRELKQTGEWLGKEEQLDIVAEDKNGNFYVALCSCGRAMDEEDYERALHAMKQAKLEQAKLCFYSEAGFSENLRREEEQGKLSLLSLSLQ